MWTYECTSLQGPHTLRTSDVSRLNRFKVSVFKVLFFFLYQSAFWHTFHSSYPKGSCIDARPCLRGPKNGLFVECVKDSLARERESSCITFHAFSSVPPFWRGHGRPGCGSGGFPLAQAALRVPLSVPLLRGKSDFIAAVSIPPASCGACPLAGCC